MIKHSGNNLLNIFFRPLRVQLHNELTYVEKTKLEKKRERNRLAATKCRQRKLDKIQQLGKHFQYFRTFISYNNMIAYLKHH